MVSDSGGDIKRTLRFEWAANPGDLIAKGFEQRSSTRCVVVFDIVDASFEYRRLVVAEIDLQRSDVLVRAHEVTAGANNERWRTEAFFPSPHGGFNIAGQGNVNGMWRSFFFAELTNGLDFPGFGQYVSIPVSEFNVSDLDGAVDVSLTRYAMEGFSKTDIVMEEASVDISEVRHEFGDSCGVLPTTQAPSFIPTTASPTTRPTSVPSRAPTMRPSFRPSTAFPTGRPVTSRPTREGDTNAPTFAPSLEPRTDLTVNPTAAPSADPLPHACPHSAPDPISFKSTHGAMER